MRIVNTTLKLALGVVLMLGLSSCASMSSEGSFQTTLVRSEPPGASVYVDGKKVGQTPEFIEIMRSKTPRFQLATAKGLEDVELPTKYRWSDSFFSNFIFLVYAPLGWALDLISGSAWEIRETHPVQIRLAQSDLKNPKQPRNPQEIVIAPPRSGSGALSDEAARALEQSLSGSAGTTSHVKPYDQTLSIFAENQYEYGAMPPSRRGKMLKQLDADLIYESSLAPTGDGGWVVSSEARDVSGASVKPGPSLRLDRDETGSVVLGVRTGLHPWWTRVLPNTLGLDFTNEAVRADMNGQTYDLEPVEVDEWWATGLKFLSAIAISNTPDRRHSYGSRWEISAVPSFRFSHRRMKLGGLVPSVNAGFLERDPQFTRSSATGGYGLEIGYLIRRHYFYLDLIPVLNWSTVMWRQFSNDRSATRTDLTFQSELGYSYAFGSNWLMKIFTRSQNENTKLWQDAFVARFGDSYVPASVTTLVSGVTIAYQFETERFRATPASGKTKR